MLYEFTGQNLSQLKAAEAVKGSFLFHCGRSYYLRELKGKPFLEYKCLKQVVWRGV